jgi:hypothetical protein
MNLRKSNESFGIKALTSREFPQESYRAAINNFYQPSLEVTKITIGQQEVINPINYDKTKAKKKYKVISDQPTDYTPENARSPELEEDEF